MSTEIKVPELPESITEATLVAWHKKPGEAVARDENLVDLETDKVVLEVPAPADGVLKEIKVEDGATVTAGQLLAVLDEGAEAGAGSDAQKEEKKPPKEEAGADDKSESGGSQSKPEAATEEAEEEPETSAQSGGSTKPLSPSVRRLVEEHELDPARIPASGRDGRLTKSDVLGFLERDDDAKKEPAPKNAEAAKPAPARRPAAGAREQRRVPMSRIRARIAERMLEAQATTAMLTSFNEVDMSAVMDIRKRYREDFEKKHGVRLGYLSFFVRAAVHALQRYPVVNASVEDGDIVYHDYWDIGVAVSTERGLVVPVIRDADALSSAEIEAQVIDYANKAREGGLTLEDITGGTFTITNGGVFGSLISTPIVNPPQSAIFGMHKIEERPVAIAGEVKIRPMMYIALTYDHRIVDGRDAVLFLVAVKEALEDPARILIDL
ncbi:MAG TPA: 2-oxoglutarate dehydrogenase complex dihydrolipoyllysine-residue succinyltransferase [Gammaproteobacteria bacterium]|nr:2-oxoglutarate dehydrogenase complex dihydrolipoyllysine-residue succinyltransferase [Gammaproteobacteria bacterium]